MQPKKNPNADHSKNSSLYFVIGLTVILFFTWRAIEWKTYATVYGYEALNIDDDDDDCLLYTSPSPRDGLLSRMPSSA